MTEQEAVRRALFAWLESQDAKPSDICPIFAEIAGIIIGQTARDRQRELDYVVEGISMVQALVMATAMHTYLKK